MSLRDLVTFAQNEISQRQMYDGRDRLPLLPPPNADGPTRLPSPEDSDLTAERPPIPEWLRRDENEILQISGGTPTIFTEGVFDEAAPVSAPLTPLGTPDMLAYYLPYHFYGNGTWGIYVRAKGILELAAEIKGAPVTQGGDDAIRAAWISLVEHELFHCLTEAAATRAEVVVRSAVYHPYFFDLWATFHEEAVANAYAHSKIKKGYSAFVTRLESWMRSQGPGYRDFHKYTGRSLQKGKLKCSQHIVRFAPPARHLPSKLPSGFLFGKTANIPTYVVLDAEIALQVLRPFPKYNGVVVKVHSREHPPPHIHVEMPPGQELTRCEWPSLQPLGRDPSLSQRQQAKLREYLQKHGADVWQRLRSVYDNPDLSMPSF
jgi:hypothetical protein